MTPPADQPRVIVLNGPAGVGKTATGRALAATAAAGACVHGDSLMHMVVRREKTVEQGLSYVGAAKLTGVYLDAGYDLVVVEFIFQTPANVQRFLDAYANAAPVHLFCLWAPLDVVQAREAARPGRERIGGRVSELWEIMNAAGPGIGVRVDTDRPLADTVTDITGRVRAGDGLIS